MLPHSFWKSSSLRIVFSNFITMIICFILIGGIVAFMVRKEFNTYLDHSVSNTKSLLEDSYKTGKKQGLLDLLSRLTKVTSPEIQIFFVANQDNKKILGNIDTSYRAVGWYDIDPSLIGMDDEFDYRVFGYKIEGLYILIGNSRELTDELAEICVTVFGYGSLVILSLVLMTGTITALKTQKRIRKIGQTLDNIAQGNLDARIGLQGTHDDIDQLSLKINTSLNQLSSLFNSMKQVSSDIAHDLKTPINRLNMYIESAAGQFGAGKDPAPFFEKARAETAAINDTFEALLRISQIEAGARKSRFTRLDLREALEPVIDAYRPVAEDKGFLFQTDGLSQSEEALCVLADKELLMQMFANIIENAIRHCPKGTLISVQCQGLKNEIKIIFCDTGSGIPEEERDKVLQRLYRLEKSRTTAGSGLGLSLVKAIAELHNIPFTLEDNQPGLCVTFCFQRIS